jgi:hypothetical protein
MTVRTYGLVLLLLAAPSSLRAHDVDVDAMLARRRRAGGSRSARRRRRATSAVVSGPYGAAPGVQLIGRRGPRRDLGRQRAAHGADAERRGD